MGSVELSKSNLLLIENLDGGDMVFVFQRLREVLLLSRERLVKGRVLGVLNEFMLLAYLPDGRVGLNIEPGSDCGGFALG